MFDIAGTVELGKICPGTGTWNRLQDGTIAEDLRQCRTFITYPRSDFKDAHRGLLWYGSTYNLQAKVFRRRFVQNLALFMEFVAHEVLLSSMPGRCFAFGAISVIAIPLLLMDVGHHAVTYGVFSSRFWRERKERRQEELQVMRAAKAESWSLYEKGNVVRQLLSLLPVNTES